MTNDCMVLVTVGFAAGVLGGLLGIGGGVVLMPVLRFVLGLSPANAAGTCVTAVFCTTFAGGIKHYRLGHVPLSTLKPVILAGAFSTALFSLIFVQVARKAYWLDVGIGMVFLLLATRMMWDGFQSRRRNPDSTSVSALRIDSFLPRKIALGSVAGILPGLFGIGTGAILVPGFSYLLRMPIKVAIGSALVCFSANALISAAAKYIQGYVDLGIALPTCIGCLVGAQLGAVINHRVPSALLKILFGGVFSWVAIRFILIGLENTR